MAPAAGARRRRVTARALVLLDEPLGLTTEPVLRPRRSRARRGTRAPEPVARAQQRRASRSGGRGGGPGPARRGRAARKLWRRAFELKKRSGVRAAPRDDRKA